ncbi:DRTGG domain-containing protein [Haloplasma contractile]|uniref:HPr kinase protein n=1 Tax=Haloplasma contractile SSD-17B TaxID=1033810 RepID=U2DR93_9MOLU|nr:DRTGG domain-containing protein [Haloplasma contractile]ERJ11097.1 HPr kinase protein [Haloplasma contractile SSD-17B]
MNVKDLISTGHFKLVSKSERCDRDIKGIYSCDLLSWVMSHANNDDAWITVQAHANIVAVASLLELSCIIVVENASVDEETIEKANEHQVPVLTTSKSAYEVITFLNDMGL